MTCGFVDSGGWFSDHFPVSAVLPTRDPKLKKIQYTHTRVSGGYLLGFHIRIHWVKETGSNGLDCPKSGW